MCQDPDTPIYMEALSGRNFSRLRRSEGQQEYSTAVLSFLCIKCNIYDVTSYSYIIHDGDYNING